MSETVGQIGLDLVANTQSFERQVNNMANFAQSSIDESFDVIGDHAGKLGKLVASAFAFDKIKDFTASCLDLGSDLAEVQNVVDVTFESMSDSVNGFAKTAMAQSDFPKRSQSSTWELSGQCRRLLDFQNNRLIRWRKP